VSVSTPVAAKRIADALRKADDARSRFAWPSRAYAGDPVRFGQEVLGIRRYWSAQREWLREFAKPGAWMAVSTGQKTGKTEAYITAVMWHFAQPNAEWYLFAPKIDHTNEVLWPRFVRACVGRRSAQGEPLTPGAYRPCPTCSRRHDDWVALASDPEDETPRPWPCGACSPLVDTAWLHASDAEKGLRAPDGRRVIAYTANKKGALGGLSGPNIAFGTDESSDVDDDVREAIQGNALGGAKFFGIGNPLYHHGWFARAFKDQKKLYTFTAQVSSRLTPNCHGRIEWSDGVVTDNKTIDPPIKALANPVGIERGLLAWRGAAAIIAARIDGRHPEVAEGQLVPLAVLTAAEARWSGGLVGEGVLQIGVDPARGTGRDYLAVAAARGRRIAAVESTKPGSHAVGARFVVDLARAHRIAKEPARPRIVYDASGKEGADFGREIRAFSDEFDIYPVYATFPPRQRRLYDKLRDELAHYFAEWLRSGAIPPDPELEAEIDALTAKRVTISFGGVSWEVARVPSNDEMERILKRHPDKRNACELAVWPIEPTEAPPPPPPPAATAAPRQAPPPPPPAEARQESPEPAPRFDPWAGADAGLRAAWGGAIDE